MLRACRLRLCANQSSIPASSSTTDLAPSVSTVKFLHPPVQLHLLRFRVRPSGSCASCPGIPSQKTSAALSNLTLDRNRVYQPCYATSPWIRSEDSQKAYNSGNHRTQRNRSESSVVYSPIQSSKMVLPTVNSGPPEEARTPRKDRCGKVHRAPSHISKTVPPTIHLGPPEGARTPVRIAVARFTEPPATSQRPFHIPST